jgi:hypothetical protein
MREMTRVLRPEEQEREAIRLILEDLAEYYSKKLSDRQIQMYTDDLIELGSDLTLTAVKKYRQSWGNDQLPLPAVLRKQIMFYHGAALT